MKRIALLTGVFVLALLLTHGLALAQEMEYEVITGEPEGEGTKRIEIRRIVSPGMDDMMGGMGCGPGAMMGGPGMGGGMGFRPACCGMMSGPGMHGGMMGGMGCCQGCAMMCGPGMGGRMDRGPGATMCGPGMGGRMMGGMACGPGGGMMAGMHGKLQFLGCLCQYERCAEMLELSEKQLAALKDTRMAAKKAAIQAMANIQIAQMELDEILKENSPDLTAVKTKISAIASLAEEMALAKIGTLQKAQKLLTKEQLEKFQACKKGTCVKKVEVKKKVKMKEHMEKMEKMKEMKEMEKE